MTRLTDNGFYSHLFRRSPLDLQSATGRVRSGASEPAQDRERKNGTCPKAGAAVDIRKGQNARLTVVVEVLNAYPNTLKLVKALRSDLSNHAKPDTKSQECSPVLESPVRMAPRLLRKRLAPKDRQRLIADYLAGAMQKELATRYGIGLSSVKTILREAGAAEPRPAGTRS